MINLLIILNIFFISFTDKPEKSAPALSPRALEQRTKWNIPTDQMDYPVSPMYLNQLRKKGVKVYHVSRWFNGATCEMEDSLANEVKKLSFVTSVEMTRDSSEPIYAPHRRKSKWFYEQINELPLFTDDQLSVYNLKPLHDAGFEGQGILMTVCDGGFSNANTMTCFRAKELELGHFDFTDDKDDFYGHEGAHGTECLSTISGLTDGYYGAATQAQYYLMRSEESQHESPKEMDNLVAALEKADSLGVNVFSVSLGYAKFDNAAWTLPKSALDGKSTRASIAATIAARKGMLVCVAAGNEGDSEWQTISSPADADSVLTVGAVGIDSIVGGFSSYGPSADGRIKPDVCAVGVQTTLINPSGVIVQSNGTSFATPLIAGLAASLWSALPEENAMQIRDRIIRSSDRYAKTDPSTPNPYSNRYGYGIPDAWKAYQLGREESTETLNTGDRQPQAQKFLRNGQLFILRHGQTYDPMGRIIRE